MGLKVLKGINYCQGILLKLQIAKELMVLELEKGNEVLIPP